MLTVESKEKRDVLKRRDGKTPIGVHVVSTSKFQCVVMCLLVGLWIAIFTLAVVIIIIAVVPYQGRP